METDAAPGLRDTAGDLAWRVPHGPSRAGGEVVISGAHAGSMEGVHAALLRLLGPAAHLLPAGWPCRAPPPAGRAKDTLVLTTGENVELQPLEDLLATSPLIAFAGARCAFAAAAAAAGTKQLGRGSAAPGQGSATGTALHLHALHHAAPPPAVLVGSGHRSLGALVVPSEEALEAAGGAAAAPELRRQLEVGRPGASGGQLCMHLCMCCCPGMTVATLQPPPRPALSPQPPPRSPQPAPLCPVPARPQEEVARTLAHRPPHERVRAFAVLGEPFSVEGGTLTRTMKPKRQVQG